MGVSNTASTLNFINNMKDFGIGILIGLGIDLVILVPIFCSHFGSIKAITSSPVEEIYHRQLVVTLDSTLNARFCPCCCKEVIDSDDVSVPHTRFGDILSPTD